MKHLSLLTFAICICISCEEECKVSQSSYEWTTTIQGESRRAIIWKPTNKCIKAPVLIYFHGRGGDAEDSEVRRQFHNLLNSMYIVYAEGTNFDDHPNNAFGWETRFPHVKTNCRLDKDIEYVQALLDHLDDDEQVEISRIGLAGHSSGGFFTLALAELMPEPFLGFACLGSYSSYAPDPTLNTCNSTYVDAINIDDSEVFNEQIIYNPAPTLFMFGTMENTIKDNDDVYNEDCSEFSYFQNSILQICKKNGAAIDCGADDFMNTFARQTFGSGQGEVQVQMYDDDHSWPAEANQWAADYFADLLFY